MDEIVPREDPVRKRAKRGTGRGRSAYLNLRLRPTDMALLKALAAEYDCTQTRIVEMALHLLAAQRDLQELQVLTAQRDLQWLRMLIKEPDPERGTGTPSTDPAGDI